MRILGIETSCDETAAAVVEDGRRILSDVVASQTDLHARYGGVVPELASRRHLECILPVVQEALSRAGLGLAGLDGVAVTYGPGLVGALLVGVSFAKGLAEARGLPLVGVNHLEAHIYANFLEDARAEGGGSADAGAAVPRPGGRDGGACFSSDAWPCVALVVSGGHADLVYVEGHGRLELLGRTRDDAAGEAFDKSARAMGLGYPGGPEVDRLAARGDASQVPLPRAFLEEGSLDFSFSGLKTAVLVYLDRCRRRGREPPLADLCAGLQQAVVDVLVEKAFAAARARRVRRILLAGGVAANRGLRAAFGQRARREGVEVFIPPARLCTDNAAMVACAGYYRLERGVRAEASLDAVADLGLGSDPYHRLEG
ncbi:MAG: tRNA (adenosine(37)-N6)-threonylcarbamoyltransferase complex transferase subunit TsaD [Acetobacteraceae bacterium]|nr:tRNA (adenosine(37)-N6)-threonylcarbamoyltransferase complex transferase subunit TsaD [Acetobacteraceae bacterium]